MDAELFRGELARALDILMPGGIPWAVAAGSAVYLYTNSRPPTDLDILVRPEDLARVTEAMGIAPETEATSWGEVARVQLGSIEIAGGLVAKSGSNSYPYHLDSEMVSRLRSVTYRGILVSVLSPEDVVALKAVLQRGPEQGKHDLEDIAALAAAMPLDTTYLRLRLELMGATERAVPALRRWEWAASL